LDNGETLLIMTENKTDYSDHLKWWKC